MNIFLGVALICGRTVYICAILVHAQWLLHLLALHGVLVRGYAILVSDVRERFDLSHLGLFLTVYLGCGSVGLSGVVLGDHD